MKVYSPSQTSVFSECQVKRELRMWQPKYATKKQIAAWMGTGMAAGLACINTHRMEAKGEWCIQQALDAAQVTFDEEMIAFQTAGGVVGMDQYKHVLPLMDRALKYYTTSAPVSVNWGILGVEQEFPDHGNCRIDLVVKDADGVICPLDFKMKEKLWVKTGETIEQARTRTIMEYEHHWNMMHYVWACQQVYGACDRYYICLGELSPKPHFTVQRFDVDNVRLGRWEDSAVRYWRQMDDIDDPDQLAYPAEAATHRNQYGQCEYYWACMEANRDPERMKHKYVFVERRKDAISADQSA